MLRLIRSLILLALFGCLTGWSVETGHEEGARCEFGGVTYFHRWSNKDQHEYTPEGQEDLERWFDMITINLHRTAKDGDALANVANSALGNYQRAGARVIRTDSKPRSDKTPAEHLVVAFFPQPTMVEVVFARFVMIEGMGCVIVYSHRIYGEKIGPEVSNWLQENGPKIEAQLMGWKKFPTPAALNARPASLPRTALTHNK